MNEVILIQLLLAHFLTDFVLQSNKMVRQKAAKGWKTPYFWIHVLLSGLLTYLLLMRWNGWGIPLVIIGTHGAIDLWKIEQEKRIRRYNASQTNDTLKKSGTPLYFIDQLLHLVVILAAWLYLSNSFGVVFPYLQSILTDKSIITILTSVVLLIWPVGLTIGKITEPFRKELTSNQTDSLNKAGIYIGIFERLLVFIFMMIGQFAAIGFLIAAKSILRISKDGENEARKKTEYVLIGTLMSFTSAILIALAAKYIIGS